MDKITIGILLIFISILGYISNWLNWRFLNYKFNYFLYYLGAFIHESSHALLCIFTGAKIKQYKVIAPQPKVIYTSPRLPVIGNLFISIAPLLGGLTFLFLINKFLLANNFSIPHFSNLESLPIDFLNFLKQIDFSKWQNLIILFLSLNTGAMIGPSARDLKNVWFLIFILIFISWPFFTNLGLLAITLILTGIIIQIILIIIIFILKTFFKRFT